MNNPQPILVINGVEERLQLVLGSRDGLIFSQQMASRRKAVQLLPLALEHCFQTAGLQAKHLGGVACVRGPGSFTGLRVVLAVALGLARGTGLPMAGLDFLPLLARSAASARVGEGELWVLTYARKGLVYLQGFTAAGEPLTEPKAAKAEAAANALAMREGGLRLLGSGLRQDPGFWRSRLPEALLADPEWDHPREATLLQVGLEADFSYEPFQPMYLRASDAEDNLEAIARERGIDLTKAQGSIPKH